MKRIALLLTMFAVSLLMFAQPQSVTFYGPTAVTNGTTATYTTNVPSGYYIIWGVSNGVIIGSSTPAYIINNSSSITIQWNNTVCGTTVNGSLSLTKFATWPPSGAPSYNGSLVVSIQENSCPPPPTCASVQSSIDGVWNSTSIPQSYKCSIINSIISGAIGNGFVDTGCLNRHGC